MANRWSDLQGLLKGLEKLSGAGCRLSYTELNSMLNNSIVKPMAQQAVHTITDLSKGEGRSASGRFGSTNSQNTPPTPEQIVANLPYVLDGLRLYSSSLLGLGMEARGEGQARPSLFAQNPLSPSTTDVKDSQAPHVSYVLNSDLTAMDLLKLEDDLCNKSALHKRLFRKVEEHEPLEQQDPIPVEKEPSVHPNPKAPPSRPVTDLGPVAGPLNSPAKLTSTARERSVPASRMSRVLSFGGLGVGLGLGILAEASRRAVGVSGGARGPDSPKLEGSLILNEANAERIVSTLCRVRGAALKLGQILSVQDHTILTPELADIFNRVRESADFMPEWQLDKVMRGELGPDWKDRFQQFEVRPFAAASIGQVHRAVLLDGQEVAVKVQYPGVAKSIDSDISNLMSLLSVIAFVPKGLFIDNIAKHMKIELAQECDYKREAECGITMRKILSQYPEYYVPEVFSDLCTDQVLTTELIRGLTIDRCVDLPQSTRNYIAQAILKLIFRELFLHRTMQTDPNWANFLYNPETARIGLLDFGATRVFRATFVNTYFKIIDAAAHNRPEEVLEYSREIGFLTGYESKIMNNAHVDSVMLLATPFQKDHEFDFGSQTITHSIQDLSGVMLEHRLCPPPPEVYSLHRKLSGLFLLAGKLNSKFNCYKIWQQIRSEFRPFPELEVQKS